jgi:hypothetical protein
MTTPNALDYLKYTAAEGKHLLEYVTDALGQLTEHPKAEDEIETLQAMLDSVRNMLVQATATFCRDGDDMNTYSDGRRVETTIDLELGNRFEYRWHPQRDHRDNRPHTVLDGHECTSGARRSVIVAADQVLDVVSHGRGLHLVEEAP